MLFQDNGSVGRSPWLVPVRWEDGWPVLGVGGKAPTTLDIEDNGQGMANIVTSDEFDRAPGDPLPLAWQWNHNPDNRFWSIGQGGGTLRLTTGRVDSDVLSARNMLTQRTFGPLSSAKTRIDVANMEDGDYAGMIALQRRYGFVGVKMENGHKSIVMVSVPSNQPNQRGRRNQPSQPVEIESIPLAQSTVHLKIDCDFRERTDKAYFYYSLDGATWTKIGSVLQMAYTLPHFMGYRFGLFNYATKTAGGFVDFDYYRVSESIDEVDSGGSSGQLPAQQIRPVGFDRFEYSGEDHTAEAPLAAGQYRNPILAGFHPDPSLCRVGKDYYLINSTFEYFPGLPIFHSTDLVNWQQIGHVIHRPEQLDFRGRRVSQGLFAPAITYHQGLFYVVCTMVDGPGNFVVTAEHPAGPWSDPIPLRFGGIDPSIFFDDDERAWVIYNDAPKGRPLYSGHRAVWIQQFDPQKKEMADSRTLLINGGIDISKKPVWIEGPHLYKLHGWYYLCCAEGGTGPQHSQVILRSKQVEGPYTPWERNPILTQRDLSGDVPGAVTCTGHADLEIGPDGNWWAVFLAVRPYQAGRSPMGRETFLLPVTWTDDDWPIILPPGQRVPLVGKSPDGVEVRSSAAPLNGSFTWRDDFWQKDLSLEWIMLREPRETWWSVNTTAGRLELTPRSEKLTGAGNPSYLGRRVRHATYTATLSVDVPGDEGVSAGLALVMNEGHHYFLAVQRKDNRAYLYLERVERRDVGRLAEADLPSVNELELRVEADKAQCSFQYRLEGGHWQTLVGDADATMISFTVPDGLFLGATVGPHVRID
jgi:alpha-N-arabinofuranosidase